MANLMAFDNEDDNQDAFIKEWKLPTSESVKIEGTPSRQLRLIIPISDAFINVKQQSAKASGTHWTLLICDIQASDKRVMVQFRHFDSVEGSTNFDEAQLVADSLNKVRVLF